MMYYEMTIAGLKRALPICPVNDKLSIGAFVIFGDCELTTAAAKALLDKAPEYDYLITAEAKGIPLVHEMARLAGDPKYMLARKGEKLTAWPEEKAEREALLSDFVFNKCGCGKTDYGIKVGYSSVDVVCAHCGVVLRMNAATPDDIDTICSQYTLTIPGKAED